MYTAPCAAWHTPVFLLNSRLGRFAAARSRSESKSPHGTGHPFFRSYGIIMPRSLTTFHSFTLGYSPRPPVSVYGTDVVCTPQNSFSCVSTPRHSIGLSASSRHQVSAEAYALRRSIHKTAAALFHCPCLGQTHIRRGGNLRPLSIGYASGASP